jgi:hypothetical protein
MEKPPTNFNKTANSLSTRPVAVLWLPNFNSLVAPNYQSLGLFFRPNLTHQKRLTGEFPSKNTRRAKLAKTKQTYE